MENQIEKYENTYHHYGECPGCRAACQPDYANVNDHSLEYVVCYDCNLVWYLHHEDETDRRDDTENWRTYRISDIQTLGDFEK